MDPVTLSFLALGGLQIVSGLMQGEAIMQNARFKKEIDDLNAQFAELDAFHAIQEGEAEVAQYDKKVTEVEGAQRTALAANNVNVGYGTAADLQTDTKVTGIMQALNIRKAAQDKATGYENQAMNSRLSGAFSLEQGSLNAGAAQAQGIIGGLNTGLSGYRRTSGAGNVAGKNSLDGYVGDVRNNSRDPETMIG